MTVKVNSKIQIPFYYLTNTNAIRHNALKVIYIACAKKTNLIYIQKIKKQITEIFKSNDLKIKIEANKKVVNFLDVTFNLTNGTYKPYMKTNNKLLYVHKQSNHPPSLIKNIPLNINKRLTNIIIKGKAIESLDPCVTKCTSTQFVPH